MLLGNLGADPELRVTPSGQSVLKLRLATTESYLDKTNTRQERTEWHSVTVWGKRGEALSKILGKGSSIFVEGSLRTSSYEKEGVKHYRTEVNANNIILAGRRGGGDYTRDDLGGGAPQRGERNGTGGKPASSPPPDDDFGGGGGFGGGGDEDIPF
jgi:single-strand DNA-binding protein